MESMLLLVFQFVWKFEHYVTKGDWIATIVALLFIDKKKKREHGHSSAIYERLGAMQNWFKKLDI